MEYDYPVNVRELENIVEHSCVMRQGNRIRSIHLPPELSPKTEKVIMEQKVGARSLETFEKQLIKNILEKHNGNKVLTAKELNLHRSTLWRKMKKYELI